MPDSPQLSEKKNIRIKQDSEGLWWFNSYPH